jgi:hypothetical protein
VYTVVVNSLPGDAWLQQKEHSMEIPEIGSRPTMRALSNHAWILYAALTWLGLSIF